MKSILQSIKPQHCERIAKGKKTIEVRKTKPEIEMPFKDHIYCTKQYYRKGDGYFQGKYCGKVMGEYICNYIEEYPYIKNDETSEWLYPIPEDGNGKTLYFWYISDLVIYDKPLPLDSFNYQCCGDCDVCKYSHYESRGRYFYDEPILICDNTIKRPPQSWCYVEEVKNERS